jgi:hypothetical protein
VSANRRKTLSASSLKTVNKDMTLSEEYKIKVRGKLKWRPALFSLPTLENE